MFNENDMSIVVEVSIESGGPNKKGSKSSNKAAMNSAPRVQ